MKSWHSRIYTVFSRMFWCHPKISSPQKSIEPFTFPSYSPSPFLCHCPSSYQSSNPKCYLWYSFSFTTAVNLKTKSHVLSILISLIGILVWCHNAAFLLALHGTIFIEPPWVILSLISQMSITLGKWKPWFSFYCLNAGVITSQLEFSFIDLVICSTNSCWVQTLYQACVESGKCSCDCLAPQTQEREFNKWIQGK